MVPRLLVPFVGLFLFTAASASAQERVNVERLPIDLERIQRGLASGDREERDGLDLRYFVDVYGQAPPIEIFSPEDNLATGAVPYGAPTHREILDLITPQEFRSPAIDINALAAWLAQQLGKKPQR